MLALPSSAAAHGLQLPGPGDRPDRNHIPETPIVGGLSSITYDERRGVYYAVSDDPAAVRYYTVALDIRDGRLTDGDVRFENVTTLLAPGGQPYAPTSIDPEGLALTKDRRLIFTSEGIANTRSPRSCAATASTAASRPSLPVPRGVPPDARHRASGRTSASRAPA